MTRTSWKQLIVGFVFTALLLLCFRAAVHHFDPITAVDMGMSADEVTHLMGAPQNTSLKDQLTVYSYPKAQIYLRDGKVLAILTPLPRWSPWTH
jgi:hypothetical protein